MIRFQHIIVQGTNTLLNSLFLIHEVLAFTVSILKGVACEVTRQLQHKRNRCLCSLGAYFCMGGHSAGDMGAYIHVSPILYITDFKVHCSQVFLHHFSQCRDMR